MEIRRLLAGDLASFFENRLRALSTAPTAFLSTYADEKSDGPGRFAKSLDPASKERAIFGAVVEGKVVATVAIGRETSRRINHKATVWGVFVDSEFRGQGLSGKLLDLAIGFAREEMPGVRAIELSMESGNKPAEKVYLSRGFVKWGTEPMAMSHEGKFYEEDQMTLIL